MSLRIVSQSEGCAGADASFQDRLVSRTGTGTAVTDEGNALKQADITSISRTVYDLEATVPSTPVSGPTALTVSSVVSDTLVADNVWGAIDAIGRNFIDTVAGSVFTATNHTYRVKYTLTTTAGSVLVWGHDHTITSLTPA